MIRCAWPLYGGCDYPTIGERYCYFHAKVMGGLIAIDTGTARKLGISPREIRPFTIGAPGQGLSDEQTELAHVLELLGVEGDVIAGALNRQPA